MQLIGPHFSEKTLLRTAHAYEAATEWSEARPEI
jgi:Asp-tRNA(Asn)/Glu-tRNA(Gln) amidotransferase A subunit family amidase